MTPPEIEALRGKTCPLTRDELDALCDAAMEAARLREEVRSIGSEYALWDQTEVMKTRRGEEYGDQYRLRFESNLEAALVDAGFDPLEIWREIRADLERKP